MIIRKYVIALVCLASVTGIGLLIWIYWQPKLEATTSEARTRIDTAGTSKPTPEEAKNQGVNDTGGMVSITYANLYLKGPTRATPIDVKLIGPLPPRYALYTDRAYNLSTDAVVSGPHIVTFQLPSVTDAKTFDSLRILYGAEDFLNPGQKLWVDVTILAPNKDKPNFRTRTIKARVMEVGSFVVALSTQTAPEEVAVADISITLAHSPESVRLDMNLTYTLTITNNGPQTATRVGITDHTSPEVDIIFISATSSQGNCWDDGSNTICSIGTLEAGASATVSIIVKPRSNGVTIPPTGVVVSNIAFVGANEKDPNRHNNMAQRNTTVLPGLFFNHQVIGVR